MTSDETGLQPPDGNGSKPVDYNPNEFWLRTLLRWYIGLIIRPSPTIREIVERRPLLAGLLTVYVGVLCSLISYAVASLVLAGELRFSRGSEPIDELLLNLFFMALFCAIVTSCFTGWAVVLHFLARRAGYTIGFRAAVSAFTMISMVGWFVFSTGILATAVAISTAIGVETASEVANTAGAIFAASGLMLIVVLYVLLMRQNHDIDSGDAAITVAVSIIPAIVFGFLLVLAWGLTVILIGNLIGPERFF